MEASDAAANLKGDSSVAADVWMKLKLLMLLSHHKR